MKKLLNIDYNEDRLICSEECSFLDSNYLTRDGVCLLFNEHLSLNYAKHEDFNGWNMCSKCKKVVEK